MAAPWAVKFVAPGEIVRTGVTPVTISLVTLPRSLPGPLAPPQADRDSRAAAKIAPPKAPTPITCLRQAPSVKGDPSPCPWPSARDVGVRFMRRLPVAGSAFDGRTATPRDRVRQSAQPRGKPSSTATSPDPIER